MVFISTLTKVLAKDKKRRAAEKQIKARNKNQLLNQLHNLKHIRIQHKQRHQNSHLSMSLTK